MEAQVSHQMEDMLSAEDQRAAGSVEEQHFLCTEVNYKQVNIRCNTIIILVKLLFYLWTGFKNWQKN